MRSQIRAAHAALLRGAFCSPFDPLAQQKRCQQAAAAAASHMEESDGVAIPKELNFVEEFIISEEDYHTVMLEEAHRKHGTHLNVPPQLPPEGEPPEVPEVILCAALKEKLASMALAYPPTHAPPPLATCGTRGLEDLAREEAKAEQQRRNGSVVTQNEAAPAANLQTTGPRRNPVEADKKFHCSYCNKPFRAKLAADSHTKLAHKNVGVVETIDGPGPGEFADLQQAELYYAANPDKGPLAQSAAASSAQATTPKAKKVYSVSKLELPEDDEVSEMLKDIWDVLGKKLVGSNFKESTAIVEGVADKRPPPGSEKSTLSATPTGAAPGIRSLRTMTTSGIPLNAHGKPMTAAEMSARFENPLGDVDFGDFDPDEDLKNPFLSPEAIQRLQARRSTAVIDSLMKQVLVQHERISILQGSRGPKSDASPSSVVSAVNKVLAANKEHKDIDGEHLVAALKHLRLDQSIIETVVSDAMAQDKSVGSVSAVGDKKAADAAFSAAFLNAAKAKVMGSTSTGGPATVAAASATPERKGSMACHKCGSTYRLLDALQDHYEEAHGTEIPDNLLAKYMHNSPASELYDGKYTANGDGAAGTVGGASSEGNEGGGLSTSGGDDGEGGLGIPTPIEEKDVSLHIRSATNIVLSGPVVEVKFGYIHSHAVCQVVVRASYADGSVSEPDVELVTVRCFGDEYQQSGSLGQQLVLGANVVVNGTLRLNRHMDTVSNKVHSYPFVSVASSCGCIQLVD